MKLKLCYSSYCRRFYCFPHGKTEGYDLKFFPWGEYRENALGYTIYGKPEGVFPVFFLFEVFKSYPWILL